MTACWPSSHRSDYVQWERRCPAFPLPSPVPLHIIRCFTQYFRNDYAGFEQDVMDESTGHTNQRIVKEQTEFAAIWSRNLEEQGFMRNVR